MPSDEMQAMADRLLEKLAALNKERDRILITLGMLREEGAAVDLDLSAEHEAPVGSADSGMPAVMNGGAGASRKLKILPDTYFGMSQHLAAKTYLQNLGHADKLENICAALVAGGVKIGGARPLETLRATLRQNTKVFVRVGESTFGIRERYPHLRELKEKEPKKNRRGAQQRKTRKGTQGKPKMLESAADEVEV